MRFFSDTQTREQSERSIAVWAAELHERGWGNWAVMQRLGMQDALEDFDHPALPDGSPLRAHCLYRLTRERWAAGRA